VGQPGQVAEHQQVVAGDGAPDLHLLVVGEREPAGRRCACGSSRSCAEDPATSPRTSLPGGTHCEAATLDVGHAHALEQATF
jgi:hypothetical protein